MQIARETKTELHAWDEEQSVIDSKGEPMDPAEAAEYGCLLWDDGLISAAFKYSNENCKAIPASRSLYDFFEEKAQELFTHLPDEEAKRKRLGLLQACEMWGAYVGSPVQRQSLKFFWLEECIEGENPFVAGTYEKILNAVAKTAREKADIKLGTKVVKVLSGEKNADGRAKSIIETAGGSRLAFDEVVCTMPLGWLKRNPDAFEPPLAPRLTKAISSIGYGTLDKVYITFPEAFWNTPTPTTTISASSSTTSLDLSHETLKVTATTLPLHQPPTTTKKQHHPGFTHWLAPTYSPLNPQSWDQQGGNLAALPPSTAHPTLLFYIYGPCASHIASLLSSTPTSQHDSMLIEWFAPYFSRLPNYDASEPRCKPSGVLATAWANDEFAGYGSYCNFQVGLEEGDQDVEVMREGMPERGMWFAGEHTAPFVALGTSTGAFWAGEGVGERIVKRYGL
ncbi:hypothetical protein MBLNU13_g01397t1 [Cladosporium sp. NU13]